MMWPRCALALFLLSLIPCRPAVPADLPAVYELVTSQWTVAPNGGAVVEAELSIRVPTDKNVLIPRVPLGWSPALETLAVVEARVEKPNGRVTAVSREAIQDMPPAGDAYVRQFSDARQLIITFLDAAPGDLLVIRTRRDMFRSRVPGGFMASLILVRTTGLDEVRHTISIPSSLPFQVETRDFEHRSEIILDRTVHYFSSQKAVAPAAEDAGTGAFDRLPRFAVSTFRNWEEFARAYADVLLPHARVTPAVRELAVSLTQNKEQARDQARALYEWVRDQVRHVRVPLTESRPDPHDAELVMRNRYGDAKDHVVLLHALLAARGIPAEFVLLNAADTATIAGPPNLQPMNHLILFLPTLNVYADTTLGVAPFGELPFQAFGKPAIHLGGAGPARRDMPLPAGSDHWAEMKTSMDLGADGTITGTTETTARGAFGVWLRTAARAAAEGGQSTAAAAILRARGTPGSGSLSFDPPASPGQDYKVRGTFQIENKSALLDGGYFQLWTGLRILPRPGDFLTGPVASRGADAAQATFCYPGQQREEISLTIPAGRQLSTLPKDTVIDTERMRFRSHWAMNDRRLVVTRAFESRIEGPLCEGALREEVMGVLKKISADLTSQTGFIQNAPVAPPPDALMDDPKKPGAPGMTPSLR